MIQMSLFQSCSGEGDGFSSICEKIGCDPSKPGWPDEFGKLIRTYLNDKKIEKIRTLSLFSGAGGLDIGFSDVGFDIVESIEIEKQFCQTLENNSGKGKQFENSIVNCVDIRNYSGKHLSNIDFIIGGPPCQTFSAAGRRANGVLGTTDARGVLFREYVRLLRELSPVGFLFENVYGIIGAQKGKAWAEIEKSFSEIGYKLFYRIIDAADYGVPQHRERLIIVGLKEGGFLFPRPTHGPDSKEKHPFYTAGMAVKDAIKSDEDTKVTGRYAPLLNDIPPGLNYSFYTEEMGHPHPVFAWRSKFSDFLYKADPETPVRTIKASGGAYTGPLHWDNRFFTYGELKRLQTFPDRYDISGSIQKAVKQIGNSVPPQMARMMAIAIREQVFNTEFPFSLPLLNPSDQLSFRQRKRELTSRYRKKAEEAIKVLNLGTLSQPKSHSFYCAMNDSFSFKVVKKEEASYSITSKWGKNLTITVRCTNSSSTENLACVKIYPARNEWKLGVSEVILNIFGKEEKAFTIAWKAFEYEIIKNNIKADLVQLNGYYQYPSNLRIESTISKNFRYANIVSTIVGGENVARILSGDELTQSWGVEISEVVEIARFLRSLGYEIRNHSTNPQIEEGSWLIPYSFPTLTPLSVQLRKKVQ